MIVRSINVVHARAVSESQEVLLSSMPTFHRTRGSADSHPDDKRLRDICRDSIMAKKADLPEDGMFSVLERMRGAKPDPTPDSKL